MNESNEPQSETQTHFDSPQSVTDLPKPGKSRWRSVLHVLLVVVIFVCGMVTGGAVTLRFMHRGMERFEHEEEAIVERIHSRLKYKYELNEDQSVLAEKIVRNHVGELAELRRSFRPKLSETMKSFEDEIADIMDEEKKKEWRENFRRFSGFAFPGIYRHGKHHGEKRSNPHGKVEKRGVEKNEPEKTDSPTTSVD